MTLKNLTKIAQRKPFQPFRIFTSEGAFYDVPDCRSIWLSSSLIGVRKHDGEGEFITPDMIVSVEPLSD